MNTFTTTNDIGKLAILAADNKVYYAPIMLVVREGATSEMVINTLKRFSYGCQMLAAGIEWDVDNSTMHQVDTLNYEPWPHHDEARVQIWVKGTIPVALENDQLTSVSINIFTEVTLVEDFINYVYMVVESMPVLTDILNANAPEQPTTVTLPPPRQESELDKAFPRDAQNNPILPGQQPPSQQTSAPVSTPDGVIDLGNYDYKQKPQYEAQYVGQVVAINVSSVARRMEAKKDGSGVYECLRVFGYYDGLPSDEHPIYDFTMYHPGDRNFGDWLTFFKSIPEAELDAPGKSIDGAMRFYYKISKSKTDDRIFWNLRKVEQINQPATNFPSEDTGDKNPPQQSYTQEELDNFAPADSGYNDPDDIPF